MWSARKGVNMRSLLARFSFSEKRQRLNCSKSWKCYAIQYISMFVIATFVVSLFSAGIEKQAIASVQPIASLSSLFAVVCQNSLVFLFILSSYYTGRIPVYSFIATNSILLALLISSFKEPSYLIIILPHGVPEFLIFFTLAAIAEEARNSEDRKNMPFYKKVAALYILLIISALIEIYITPALFSLIF